MSTSRSARTAKQSGDSPLTPTKTTTTTTTTNSTTKKLLHAPLKQTSAPQTTKKNVTGMITSAADLDVESPPSSAMRKGRSSSSAGDAAAPSTVSTSTTTPAAAAATSTSAKKPTTIVLPSSTKKPSSASIAQIISPPATTKKPTRAQTESSFAAAATPMRRGPTRMEKKEVIQDETRCPECQGRFTSPKQPFCLDKTCSLCPAYRPPSNKKKSLDAVVSTASSASQHQTSKSTPKKRKRVRESDDEQEESDVEEILISKAQASATKSSKSSSSTSSTTSEKKSSAAPTKNSAAAAAAPISSPSSSTATSRDRAAKPSNLVDEDHDMYDDANDEDFKGSSGRGRGRPSSKPANFTAINTSNLVTGGRMRVSSKDSDLSAALAASRASATPEQVAHLANMTVQSQEEKAETIWLERQNDPRHLATWVTGTYIVHQVEKVPEGYVRPSEDGEMEDDSARSIASTATGAPAILFRNGFISSSPNESSRSIEARSIAYHYICASLESTFRQVIQSTNEEMQVFQQMEAWVQEAFTDFGATGGEGGNMNVRIATNTIVPSPSSSSQQPFLSHPLPVLLLNAAGLNLEDHELFVAGFQTWLQEKTKRAQERKLAEMKERRKRLSGGGSGKKQKVSHEDDGHNSSDESELEKEEKKSARKPYHYTSHKYRGLQEGSKLDFDMDEKVKEQLQQYDDDVEDVTQSYPQPAPFVITLPSTPSNLFHLVRAIYLSCVEQYPSPKQLSTAQSSTSFLSSRKLLEKSGGLEGGLVYILEKWNQWMKEHREMKQFHYYEWAKKHKNHTAGSSKETPMEIDDDSDDEAAKMKSNGKKKSSAASKKRPRDEEEEEEEEITTNGIASNNVDTAADSLPSYIYPKLLLLLPSLDSFPSGILTQFLELLQTHPTMKHFDTRFPITMVWPCGSGLDLVHSALPKTVTDRCWFQVVDLTPSRKMMERIVEKVFRGALTSMTTATSLNNMSAPVLELPFHLSTDVMQFLLTHFHSTNMSLVSFMKVIKFIVLDLCDAGSGSGRQEIDGESNSSNRSANSLTPTFLHAWVKQQKRLHRAISAGLEESATSSTNVQEKPDPIQVWIHGLSDTQLNQLRALPSMSLASTVSSSKSKSTSAASTKNDNSAFIDTISDHLTQLQLHRLNFPYVVKVVTKLAQTVGVFNQESSSSSSSRMAIFFDGANTSAAANEFETWLYLLSNTLSVNGPSSSTSASPSSSAFASSFARFGPLIQKYSNPTELKTVLEQEIAGVISSLKSRINQLKNLSGVDLLIEWLTALVSKWQAQLSHLKSGTTAKVTTSTGTAASSTPTTIASSKSNVGGGQARRSLLLQTANARIQTNQIVQTSLSSNIQSFLEEMAPAFSSLPLSELITYDAHHKLRARFHAQQESAIYTALTKSEYYLGPTGVSAAGETSSTATTNGKATVAAKAANRSSATSAAGVASSASSHFHLDLTRPSPRPSSSTTAGDDLSTHLATGAEEDIVVAFQIFQSMNGILVNLADWFQTFKVVLRGDTATASASNSSVLSTALKKSAGAKKTKLHHTSIATATTSSSTSSYSGDSPLSDSGLQVRFLTCLKTLAELGYLKATNRRVDHVIKLTLHRPY